MAACRSCGAEIVWSETVNGKPVPISTATGENHFIDCPQRRAWRKPPPPAEEQGSLLDAPAKPADSRYPD